MNPETATAATAAEVEARADDVVNNFDRLYEEHYHSLYRVIRGIVLDAAAAEDLTQEAFVKAYRARHRWRPEQAPRVWLHRIGVNTAISHARNRQVQGRLFDKLQLGRLASVPPDPTVGADEDLAAALRHLKPGHRATVILHYYHGYPYAEIAQILGVPAGTVGSRISTALQQMRAHMSALDKKSRQGVSALQPVSSKRTNMQALNPEGP